MPRLILEIEVPDFSVDGVNEALADDDHYTLLDVVTEEWMRDEVGVTFVTIPGEKCMNHEFEVMTRTCRIVGARIVEARP